MSLIQSIPKFRKKLGYGISREAFYSRKYQCVIKRSRPDGCGHRPIRSQMLAEINLFERMEESEREFFPVIEVLEYKEEKLIAMHLIKPISSNKDWEQLFNSLWRLQTEEKYNTLCAQIGLDCSYNKAFWTFVRKYHIDDLHTANVGVYNNHLAIIDAGLN